MTGADWAIIGAIVLSILLAASQGFFFEVFSFAGVVLGYLFAAWEFTRLAGWLSPYVKALWIAELAAFFLIFLAVVMLAGMVGRIVRWAIREAGLRWFDRLLGAGFGFLRGIVIVAVVVLGLASFAPGSRILADSKLGPYFLVVARAATWVAPSGVRARFRQGVYALHGATESQDSATTPAPGRR
jgi:membrane protein required for colicin V production